MSDDGGFRSMDDDAEDLARATAPYVRALERLFAVETFVTVLARSSDPAAPFHVFSTDRDKKATLAMVLQWANGNGRSLGYAKLPRDWEPKADAEVGELASEVKGLLDAIGKPAAGDAKGVKVGSVPRAVYMIAVPPDADKRLGTVYYDGELMVYTTLAKAREALTWVRTHPLYAEARVARLVWEG